MKRFYESTASIGLSERMALRDSKIKDVAIVAGTLTGNRGAEAMVTTCIQEISTRYPDACIHVLTYYPTADARVNNNPRVFIHSATPVQLVLNWLPLALLAHIFRSLKRAPPRMNGAGILSLLEIDALFDVAGVAFVDGREKFLPYNVLSLFPFLLHRIPVMKVSQAIGPISSPLNRLCAKYTLKRVGMIVARGHITYSHLKQFSCGTRLHQAPDISFLLDIPESKKIPYTVRQKIVSIGPSSLVAAQSSDYLDTLARLAEHLVATGYEVRLIAHAWREGATGPRNNDLPTAKSLSKKINTAAPVPILGEGRTALELKQIIGESSLLVTSRLHGMIAALSTATPVVAVGWNHKYEEVLDDFGLSGSAIVHNELEVQHLISLIVENLEKGNEISDQIATHLPRVKKRAKDAFEHFLAKEM